MKKLYLSFDELCDRWNFNNHELHSFIAENRVTPSYIWERVLLLCHWVKNDETNLYVLEPKLDQLNLPIFKEKNQWVFLRDAIPTGAYKYKFLYGSESLFQSNEDSDAKWYKFCYGRYADGTNKVITEDEIQKDGVFFLDAVEAAELRWKNEIGLSDIPIQHDNQTANSNIIKALSSKERTSLLNIIAALHQTLLEHPSREQAPFKNQTELLRHLETYNGYQGLSKSNLEKVLPEARKTMGLDPLK